ncbi:MAG: aldolase/citrate lyase family protein [Dehalococcoidia bacterium]
MQKNTMKAKIKAGQPAFGVSVQFPSPELVEMIGELGFDWVMLDCEHGSITPDTIGPMILAAEVRGLTPIVRPEVNRPEVINRYLDRGAMGVQVPHVNTKEEAIAAVRACRYYPEGDRGLGGGRMADFGFGTSTAEHVKEVNAEMLVCIQIEHTEAVENLDEILTVDGVDVFFIGPTDLSQSMGHPGNRSHPDVEKVLDETFAKIHAAGKASGTPSAAEGAAKNAAAGILYHYTHIPTFMSHYGNHFMKTVGR